MLEVAGHFQELLELDKLESNTDTTKAIQKVLKRFLLLDRPIVEQFQDSIIKRCSLLESVQRSVTKWILNDYESDYESCLSSTYDG